MTVRALLVSVVLVGAVVPALEKVAHAEEEVIALPALVPASFPQKLASRLSRESAARLSKMGLRVRRGADINLAIRAAADCADPACLKERLGATGARLAARIVLGQTEQGWNAKLEVTSLRMGRVLVAEEADCAGCDVGAVVELALSLIDGVQIPENDPEPEPEAPPPPPEPEAPPPPPEPPPPPPPPSEPAATRISSFWTWAPIVAGVVLIGASMPLWAIDGEPTCDGPSQTCPNLHDFFVSAALLTGAGFVALITGGTVALIGLGHDEPDSSGEGVSLRLGPSGLAGTF